MSNDPGFSFKAWECLGGDAPNRAPTLDCIGVVFQNVIAFLLILAGAVAVIFVILSGVKFLTSGGDPKQVEGARHTMTYAIIGLIVVLLAFGIVNIIADLTKTDCIKEFGLRVCP